MADCAATPNDPVCMAFYGTTPKPKSIIERYVKDQNAILAAFQQGPLTYQSQGQGSTFQTPSTAITTIPPATPWYKTWWGIGLLALGAGVTYFKIVKPRMTKAA